MRVALSALLIAGSLGSCAFLTDDGFQPVQNNLRLTADVSYASDLEIDGPAGSASSDFDEEMYQLAYEWEDADGFAPYVQVGRGSWTFDWPGDVDIVRWNAGARWYGGELGDDGGWFDNTRAYGDLSLSLIDPESFQDGNEYHRYHTALSVNFGAGLQRHLHSGMFFELGARASFGQASEVVRDQVAIVSAENDWDWYHVNLVIGVSRRF